MDDTIPDQKVRKVPLMPLHERMEDMMITSEYCYRIDNVLVPKAWKEIFDSVPNREAGQLIKALFDVASGEPYHIDPELNLVFKLMAQKMEESAQRYCAKVEGMEDF